MRRLIILTLSLVVTAVLCAGGVSIRGVELLEGDQFIQIRFLSSEAMPPIPEVTEKDGNRLVLISDKLDFQLLGSPTVFNSPLIKEVRTKNGAAEIELHKASQYRIFSNEDGLFVEFPKPSNISAVDIVKMTSESVPVIKDPVGNTNALSEVEILETTTGGVKLKMVLPQKTPYEVIPIENEPYRLAIDLKNTKGRALKQDINRFNVRKVRGGYNTPDVYRIVFDLDFMSNYRIDTVADGLLIEFFDKNTLASAVPIALASPDPIQPTVLQEEIKELQPVKISEPVDESFFKDEAAQTAQKADDPEVPEKIIDNNQLAYLKTTIDKGAKTFSGAPMDFVFKNADLTNVLKSVAKIANLNIVVDPGVTGRVTSELVQVPWDQALDLFLKINKLDLVLEGNILRIGKVEELAKEAEQRTKMQEARQMDGKLEVFIRPLSYAKASTVDTLLKKQLSKRGDITVDERSNSLIISEIPDRIKILDRILETLDKASQQVSIEARIVESSGVSEEAFGIQWGFNGVADTFHGNQTSLKFPSQVHVIGSQIANMENPGIRGDLGGYAVNLPAQGRNAGVGFSLGNIAGTFGLDIALSSLQKKGKVKIISAPRTTTQNNMEAELIQGKQIPVQTVQNNTVTVRYVPAALELKVKPQITAEGTILMDIDIKNNSADFANLVNGIPPITTQSAKNSVMIKDGGTIVIGGLYKVETSESSESVPLLSKIPLLGNLFKNKTTKGEKKELLIFITPRIVK